VSQFRQSFLDGLAIASLCICLGTIVLWERSGYYLFSRCWQINGITWDIVDVNHGQLEYVSGMAIPHHPWVPASFTSIRHELNSGPLYRWDVSMGTFNGRMLIHFPLWWLWCLFSAFPIIRVVQRVRAIKRLSFQRGLCPQCGYDLRATPDRCPECGIVATKLTPR
jgi:hypothetical protein